MKIMIGGQDYTSALDAAHPLTIERKLNEPSVCRLWLTLPAGTQSAPAWSQPVRISGDDGSLFFTGYVAAAPTLEYAGLGTEGPRYRISVQAVSDECLLDRAGISPLRGQAGMAAGPALSLLVAKTGSTSLSTESLSLDAHVSLSVPAEDGPFSSAAASVAIRAKATSAG